MRIQEKTNLLKISRFYLMFPRFFTNKILPQGSQVRTLRMIYTQENGLCETHDCALQPRLADMLYWRFQTLWETEILFWVGLSNFFVLAADIVFQELQFICGRTRAFKSNFLQSSLRRGEIFLISFTCLFQLISSSKMTPKYFTLSLDSNTSFWKI